MSLLMDALKKAEQEKKEAARKRKAQEDSFIHLQDGGDALETASPHPEVVAPTEAAEPEQEAQTLEAGSPAVADSTLQRPALELSLAPVETGAKAAGPEELPSAENQKTTVPSLSEEVTLNITLDQVVPTSEAPALNEPVADQDETARIPIQIQTADEDGNRTFHGVDLDKQYSPELYEDTIQGQPFRPELAQRSYDETLPGVPAAQLARDIGSQDQPTPVAAQTIFSATGTYSRRSTGFQWLLISLAVLAVGAAMVGSYYWLKPIDRAIPSPIVARGVETIISGQELAAASQAQTTPAPDAAPDLPPAATVIGEPGFVSESGAESSDTVVADQGAEVATDDAISRDAVSTSGDTVAESTAVVETPEAAVAEDESLLPTVIEPPRTLIRISRSQAAQDTATNLVGDAYAAYQSGDMARSAELYREALRQTPGNRDALLGLAAIAAREGETAVAMEIYLQLLKLNPLDPIARAAVIGQQGGEDVTARISRIKSMLYEQPEQPLLHFTLGRLYATNDEWSAAQQAFFDAYRLDSTNPDYALNLAVSLDRLGQSPTALDYYQTALDLAASQYSSFDQDRVRARIATLAAGD